MIDNIIKAMEKTIKSEMFDFSECAIENALEELDEAYGNIRNKYHDELIAKRREIVLSVLSNVEVQTNSIGTETIFYVSVKNGG